MLEYGHTSRYSITCYPDSQICWDLIDWKLNRHYITKHTNKYNLSDGYHVRESDSLLAKRHNQQRIKLSWDATSKQVMSYPTKSPEIVVDGEFVNECLLNLYVWRKRGIPPCSEDWGHRPQWSFKLDIRQTRAYAPSTLRLQASCSNNSCAPVLQSLQQTHCFYILNLLIF